MLLQGDEDDVDVGDSAQVAKPMQGDLVLGRGGRIHRQREAKRVNGRTE